MSPPPLNYFVCTLGQAAQNDIRRPYQSVNDLVEFQAKNNPDLPAIGFYSVSSHDGQERFTTRVLDFQIVRDNTAAAASLLSEVINTPKGKSIGLLAASSLEFLFTWLACIWLGHPVLLIAPQCSAAAIAHLTKICDVAVLLIDEKHQELADNARQHAAESGKHQLNCQPIPFTSLDHLVTVSRDNHVPRYEGNDVAGNNIAYLHHTSGTSSGLPKPIPQSHHGAVGVLPALSGKSQATFTTTPLYHGGPADIFRAWTSDAMIWLFPSKDVPVTAKNVTICLESAQQLFQSGQMAPVKYFTSVPYILQMMAEDDTGLRLLQDMDLVGVGGAALAKETGDKLVQQGVRLVSRFGAAECGFLLSSHRDYDQDKAWQYLRHDEKVTQIRFEARDENLYELVIGPDWPHMAKHSRDDGSYATSDLFARHPDLPNAWRYHSRADSQLTLITGKKFDPAPLEDAIVAALSHISDALVFGTGKPYPGVLLFKAKEYSSTDSSEILVKAMPLIERLNSESQSHARIPRNMIIVMDQRHQPLEKSSKGTILRNQAHEAYHTEIEAAYSRVATNTNRDVPDEELPNAILDLIESIIGDDSNISADGDLFAHGVDSVACVQIRHGLSLLLPDHAKKLPLTVVEDSRTVDGLAELVRKLRRGDTSGGSRDDQRFHIPELVRKYSDFSQHQISDAETATATIPGQVRLTVLLTGPTGSLGSHVLSALLDRPDVHHVYLLVRGASLKAARERVLKALSGKQLPIPINFDQKVTILQCKISDPNLGLSESDYKALQRDVDLVLHLAWSVNFLLSLHSFAPHFAGIQNLLKLVVSSRKKPVPRFVFCSSVASVSQYNNLSERGHDENRPPRVPENIVTDINAPGPTGYALSKLTAELILARAATITRSLSGRITILRVGQLSADTRTGTWNKSEAYPQILASAKFTRGVLPDLGIEEKLSWVPVDVAAASFVEASLTPEVVMSNVPTEHIKHRYGEDLQYTRYIRAGDGGGRKSGSENGNSTSEGVVAQSVSIKAEEDQEVDLLSVRVLHLLNPNTSHTFTDFLVRLQQLTGRVANDDGARGGDHGARIAVDTRKDTLENIQIVPANEWLEALESLQGKTQNRTGPSSSATASTSNPERPSYNEVDADADPMPLLRLLPFWKQAYSTRRPCFLPTPSKPNDAENPDHELANANNSGRGSSSSSNPDAATTTTTTNNMTLKNHGTNDDNDDKEVQNPPKRVKDLIFDMHNSLLTMSPLTYWMGLNTVEGQGRRRERARSSNDDTRSSTLPYGVNGNRILNGDDDGDVNPNNGVIRFLDGRRVEGGGEDNDDDDEVEDGGVTTTSELLRSRYVLKVWRWVLENVP